MSIVVARDVAKCVPNVIAKSLPKFKPKGVAKMVSDGVTNAIAIFEPKGVANIPSHDSVMS